MRRVGVLVGVEGPGNTEKGTHALIPMWYDLDLRVSPHCQSMYVLTVGD